MGDEIDRLIKKNNEVVRETWSLRAERDALAAERDRLRAALTACDVVMDTAALHGLPQQLPPAYRDSWAAAHLGARAELEGKADG